MNRYLWIRVFTLMVLNANARANDFRDSPRRVVSLGQYPQFSVVGELQHDENLTDGRTAQHFGSAVIVSPCYILTNFHVAFGDDTVPVSGKDYTALFRAGAGSNGAAFAGHTSASAVLWGDHANDWALMRLEKCVGLLAGFGWIEPSRRSADELRAGCCQSDANSSLVGALMLHRAIA